MQLGMKIRVIRKSSGVSMRRLADLTGLSKGFISQVECGVTNPSLASLKKITKCLGIPLTLLFDGVDSDPLCSVSPARVNGESHGGVKVVRSHRRKSLIWPDSKTEMQLLTPDSNRKLEVIVSIRYPGGMSGSEYETHDGEEFALVLDGCFEVEVGNDVFVLEQEDSIYFPAHLPHRTQALGSRPAKVLWVLTPPSGAAPPV